MRTISSSIHPAPRPASKRPFAARLSVSAAWANSTGERNRLFANDDVIGIARVAQAISVSTTQRWGYVRLIVTKWSLAATPCQPSASLARVQSPGLSTRHAL